ncbi:Panacea domain-containing protein [Lactococcus garvieae]|uniref:Panacea domain-containing protein n=1 Tax=Lactococcus garvieae TaxID=1363 RepID=UPI00385544F3
MYYKSMNIADYFVKSSIKQNIEINNLKLQKLLYYFYAKKLVEGDENPFDEKFEKWQYGPVLPDVYHTYKQFYGSEITAVPNRYLFNSEDNSFEIHEFDEKVLPAKMKTEIDEFVMSLKKYDAFELVERTHQHDDWKNDESKIQAGFQHIKYDDKVTLEYFKNHIEEQLWQQA